MYLKDLLFYHFIATSFKSNQSYIMQRSTKRKEAARTECCRIPGNEKNVFYEKLMTTFL